jgi:hypothetical protein
MKKKRSDNLGQQLLAGEVWGCPLVSHFDHFSVGHALNPLSLSLSLSLSLTHTHTEMIYIYIYIYAGVMEGDDFS